MDITILPQYIHMYVRKCDTDDNYLITELSL